MKKIDFERLKEQDMFGSFQSNKLSSLVSANLKGGQTSTSLCKTDEESGDKDSNASGENPRDPRCY